MTPIDIDLPGLSETIPCDRCRFVWERVLNGRTDRMCTRWRRLAHRRCVEYEVGVIPDAGP